MSEIELLKILIFINISHFAFSEFKQILTYVSKIYGGGLTNV